MRSWRTFSARRAEKSETFPAVDARHGSATGTASRRIRLHDFPAGCGLARESGGRVSSCMSVLKLWPKWRMCFTGPACALTGQVVAEFIDVVRKFATVIRDVPREFALERDPKDEPYLNLACRSGAEYLVTRDNDLLDLAVSSSNAGLALRQRFPRLRIVEPVAFLLAVRDWVNAIS